MGGKYSGKKSSKINLGKWSKQKWDYVSKKDRKKKGSGKSKGRYLPKSVGNVSVPKSVQLQTERKRKQTDLEKVLLHIQKIARMVRNAK